jgi:hypothetical protein
MQLLALRGRQSRLRAVVNDHHGEPLVLQDGQRLSFTCTDPSVEAVLSLHDGVLEVDFPVLENDLRWTVLLWQNGLPAARVATGSVRVVDG